MALPSFSGRDLFGAYALDGRGTMNPMSIRRRGGQPKDLELRAELLRRACETIAVAVAAPRAPLRKSGRTVDRTPVEVIVRRTLKMFQRAHPKLARKNLERLKQEIRAGLESWTELEITGLAELHLTHIFLFEDIVARGPSVSSRIGVDREGRPIFGTEANPSLDYLIRLGDLMCLTAGDMRLSKKAQGEAASRAIRERSARMQDAHSPPVPPTQ